jgi:hypothetical protein
VVRGTEPWSNHPLMRALRISRFKLAAYLVQLMPRVVYSGGFPYCHVAVSCVSGNLV